MSERFDQVMCILPLIRPISNLIKSFNMIIWGSLFELFLSSVILIGDIGRLMAIVWIITSDSSVIVVIVSYREVRS